MSSQVNIHEAKTNLSRLVQRALNGEDIVIAKAGRPLVRMVPITDRSGAIRRPGSAKGQVEIAPDFDDPLPVDIRRHFE